MSAQKTGRLDVHALPKPRQVHIRVGRPLFGLRSGAALVRLMRRKSGLRGVADAASIARSCLASLEPRLAGEAPEKRGSSDREFLDHAKAIAQHAAALHQLLYGVHPDDGRRSAKIASGAWETLFAHGATDRFSFDALEREGEIAAQGTVVLHRAAREAVDGWARAVTWDESDKRGKPGIKDLVFSVARLYADAFGVAELRQPSVKSPVVPFCLFVITAMLHRIRRRSGYLPMNKQPYAIRELNALDECKIAEHLRAIRQRPHRGKRPPGADS